jgi:hypothetical protein
MPIESKLKRFNAGDKGLKKTKNGDIVSVAMSKQSKAGYAKNPRLVLRAQAVKEVGRGRNDRRELFVKNSDINKAVKTRYHELLVKNNLPIVTVRSKPMTGKRPKSASSTKNRTRRAAKGGWFFK